MIASKDALGPDSDSLTVVASGPRVFTVAEVAAILRVGKRAIYSMCEDGRLPCVRIGRSLRVPAQVIEQLTAVDGSPAGEPSES